MSSLAFFTLFDRLFLASHILKNGLLVAVIGEAGKLRVYLPDTLVVRIDDVLLDYRVAVEAYHVGHKRRRVEGEQRH